MDVSAAELIAARPSLAADALDGLTFEGVPLAAIAAAHGTPCWVYGADTLRRRFAALRNAVPGAEIHYAVKANDHLAILAVLAAEGAGADVVSGGEFLRARMAGIPARRIVFSGVGKTASELKLALEGGVGQINVESAEELQALSGLAQAHGHAAPVALRVNPDVDAGTHEKISTGRAGDKFGIPLADIVGLYEAGCSLPAIAMRGLAVHIGSQIFGTASFSAAYRKLADLVVALRAKGLPVRSVDCGGGLGIPYQDEPTMLPDAWGGAIRAAFGKLDVQVAIEPGRWLAGPAGILLASVIRTRRAGMSPPIIVLDAAMNDLARPAMYGAFHAILPVAARQLSAAAEPADIAGPVCESADMFGRARKIAPLPDDAVVAILDAGAYGAVMSSTYNARPLAAQVLIDATLGDPAGFRLIRARQAATALWEAEILPERGVA
jgi:diaminopimelate decarboxylase